MNIYGWNNFSQLGVGTNKAGGSGLLLTQSRARSVVGQGRGQLCLRGVELESKKGCFVSGQRQRECIPPLDNA